MEQKHNAQTFDQAAELMDKIKDAYQSYMNAAERAEWLDRDRPDQLDAINQEKILVEHNYSRARQLYDLDPGAFLETYGKYAGNEDIDIIVYVLAASEASV